MVNEQDDTWVPPGAEPEWVRWFDELADLSVEERAARLAVLADDRPELAARLEQLFAAEEGSARLLSRPVLERAPDLVAAALEGEAGPATDVRIGPYRLLDLLGRGGMGEVYRAERADGVFEQRVALKLVKRGMDTEEILRRFHRERQILARLEHPGIARILDGGTAPDGRPYFVLELVEGEPILTWCRRTGLSLEERLHLLIAACEAVDVAHRNLVVHRDLKPSNLLVTQDGQVKLLDFGIAKLLADDGEDWSTRHEQRLLTPAYAAPEQLLGEPVTTATDVYALGIILYELLTGRSPHPGGRPLSSVSPAEERDTTERPSTVLRREGTADAAGISDPRRFARRVQGDLDTVVLTALRRDPARRYRSAADLAADLRRFLEGRPIEARPDSVLYRGSKLVLRHKLATVAIAAAIASLVGGLVVSLRQAEIAKEQAQRAERVKELLVSIFREADAETGQGPTVTAREILDAGARRVETELAGEPEVRAELLDAVAQIQQSLGLFDPARETARASLAARQKLFGAASVEAAMSLTTLTEVAAGRGDLEEGLRLAEQARPALEQQSYGSPEWQRLTAMRAFLLRHQGKSEQALPLVQEIVDVSVRQFGPENVETARRRVDLAGVLGDISRFQEAESEIRKAIAVLEASPRAGRVEISIARRLLADLLATLGSKEEAVAEFAAVLNLQRGDLGPDHIEVAFTLIPYGHLLNELRRDTEAEQALREAIRILEPLDHFEIGAARRYLGFCLMNQARYAEAEQQFIAAERFLLAKVGEENPVLWAARLSQGWAQLRLGRLDDADRTLSAVVAHHESAGPEGNEIRAALKYLGEVERLRGRIDRALALHRRALEIELKLFGATPHPGVAASNHQLALDLLEQGTPAALTEARRRIDAAIAYLHETDPDNPRLDNCLLASGRIALAEGNRERARRELTEAVTRLLEHRGPDDPFTIEAQAALRQAL